MTSLKLLGLAAIVASTLATPAFAQTTVDNSGRCTGLFQDPNCQNLTPGNPTTDRAYRRRHMARGQVNPDDGTRSGFWPVDTAGAVAGAAVGTAAAVASAPFRGWDGFVNPFNPCLPHVNSRTCKKIVPFANAWAPFNSEQDYYLALN